MKAPTGLRAPLASHSRDTVKSMKTQLMFGLRIELLPLIAAAMIFSGSLLCGVLFVLQGRYTAYLPTISETAAGYPNATVFGVMMSIAAACLMLILTLYVSALDCWNELSRAKEVYLRLLSYSCALLTVLVGSVNLGEELLAHMIIAILFFFLTTILMISVTAIAKERQKKTFVLRVFACVCLVIGFCMVTFVGSLLKTCLGATINTAGEYVFFVAIFMFFCSFGDELSRVKLHVVVTDDRVCEL